MKLVMKNGDLAWDEDDDVARDGTTLRFPLQMMDAMPEDPFALHKPGYRFADSGGAHDADEAYAQYCRDLQDAWMGKERREREKEADRQAPDLSDARVLRDAADEARRQYIERTVNAWRTAR